MKIPPPDRPPRRDETPEGLEHEHEGDGKTADLADLIRQREEFAHDVSRIEATLAREAEASPGLYERLLRFRRISGKLDNRIQLVRLQQKLRAGN